MSRRFWSPLAQRLQPYVPGEQPQQAQLLKLNTNESPYPPSPRVIAALRAIDGERLLRYPDPSSARLREAIAAHHGIDAAQVFVGNGSDEVLAHAFAALLAGDGELQFPDITYSFYPVWCQLYGVRYRCVPLREDFAVAVADFDPAAAAVLLPNPNAPTGRLLPLAAIRELLAASAQRLVVIDEAYIDFGGHSAVGLVQDFDNLLVVQTLSKSRALAGLRVGLAIGQPGLVEALQRVKDSFNSYPVDCVAEAAAVAAYTDDDYFRRCCRQVMEQRERLRRGLEGLDFEVLPSAANFLFARHRRLPGRPIFEALRERGIILRRWDRPRIADYLRISVGTAAQVTRLLQALAEVLESGAAQQRSSSTLPML